MQPVLNNTKWRELRSAMCELKGHSPAWRTKCVTNGYITDWDGEWFYHFSDGGYSDVEWVEIRIETKEHEKLVLSELKKINVPGHKTENGYKVYGYIQEGQHVDYI